MSIIQTVFPFWLVPSEEGTMNLVQIIFPLWPFSETVRCARCGEPVDTREAVAVIDCGILAGMAHAECE